MFRGFGASVTLTFDQFFFFFCFESSLKHVYAEIKVTNKYSDKQVPM